MPFQPNADNNFPPAAADDIVIRFAGLLLLTPVTRAQGITDCKVGVLQAAGHTPGIKVKDKGTQTEVPTPTGRPITFPVNISSVNAGVTKFVSTPVATPFPGNEDPDPNKRKDFRWSVDLKALHQNATPTDDEDRMKYLVTLSDGLLFTARLTDSDRLAVHIIHPTGAPKNLNRIAEEIGAYIKLAPNQKLRLEWIDQGAQMLELPVAGSSGQGYTIRITNLPLNPTQHDDFDSYYTFAVDTTDQHFKMNFYRRIGVDVGENVDSPCMSGSLDGDGRSGS